MTHLDEGRLQALMDGELGATGSREARAHIEACAACREALAAAGARARGVTAALAVLDAPPPTARVRERVLEEAGRRRASGPAPGGRRARVETGRGTGPTPPRWRGIPAGALSRAAVVTLLLAGGAAAAALPGSPLRSWIEGGGEPVEAGPAAPAAAAAADEEVGVRVAASDGRVRIAVDGLPSGALIEIVRGPADGTAAVYAPDGARFRSGDGVLEVSTPRGPVRVTLPAGVEGEVTVAGRPWLESDASGLTASVPAAERDAGRVLFRVP